MRVNEKKNLILSNFYLFAIFLLHQSKKGPPLKEALSSNLKVPIFRLYGVNEAGNSILAHLYDYVPYLYCSAPNGVKNSDLHKFTEALNTAAKFEVKTKEVPNNIVLGIKVVTKEVSLNFLDNSVLKIKLFKFFFF